MADISIILDDGTEDEISIDLCCHQCSKLHSNEYNWLLVHGLKNQPIQLSVLSYQGIDDLKKFISSKL